MDEVVKKVAALGLPGVILVITMAATGFTGAAAITAALAFLGRIEGLHLLASPTNPDNNREALVVNFREIYSLSYEYILKHSTDIDCRWRLKSPYLEHFSQAFARLFMRVGLPSSIPRF